VITVPFSFGNHLIVHREEGLRSPRSSSFCPLLFYAPSTPNLVYPQNASSPGNAQQKKRKKAQKTIEGYINSYIQKSKKEAKARRKKSRMVKGDRKDAIQFGGENKTRASPVELLVSCQQDHNTCTRGLQERQLRDVDVLNLFRGLMVVRGREG
jgi:hypothetical protein